MMILITKRIWHVALPIPNQALLDYLPCPCSPDWYVKPVEPGMRLLVPYGHRILVGILISIKTKTNCPINKLKPAISILDDQCVLPKILMTFCMQVAQYYHRSLGEVLMLALPKKLRTESTIKHPEQCYWVLNHQIDLHSIKIVSKTQKAILVQLKNAHGALPEYCLKQAGFSREQLKRLAKRLYIYQDIRREKILSFYEYNPAIIETPLPLTQEQEDAVNIIIKQAHHFFPLLLYGVTGSGKTEVYLQVISHVIHQKKQALILIPEISLTPQTVQRFQKRFSAPVMVLHSKLSDTERYAGWYQAQSGTAGIIIGTRSCIFTPLPALGIIIIDEEHDTAYKQQDNLRYSARDMALIRGKQANIPVILGSATPSLESLHHALQGHYHYQTLTVRPGKMQLPDFKIIDMRKQTVQAGLSNIAITHIHHTLLQKQQVLIFLNQRGYAPSILCESCGHIMMCRHCDAYMTLHFKPAQLQCHHCSYMQCVPTQCPDCKNPKLIAQGAGTERAEQMLQSLFPQTTIIRIDRDSTQKKNSLSQLLHQITQHQSAILIGTQMLAKGHHFPNVTLAVILNIDRGFFSTDFRGEEKTAQLILQVSGRSGRSEKKGLTLIQTYKPDHPTLQTLIHQGYSDFAKQQLHYRKMHHLPPYSYLTLFSAESVDYATLNRQINAIAQWMKDWVSTLKTSEKQFIQVIGPMPSPIEKRQNKYRSQLLIQSTQRNRLHQLIHIFLPHLYQLSRKKKFHWTIDIDPQDFL
ncbi:MAG: primosomal protein N' [Endozoicomonadaceae bacterium]|nr:primosomal protein N' [Endozoicomonadaceae bacterium]